MVDTPGVLLDLTRGRRRAAAAPSRPIALGNRAQGSRPRRPGRERLAPGRYVRYDGWPCWRSPEDDPLGQNPLGAELLVIGAPLTAGLIARYHRGRREGAPSRWRLLPAIQPERSPDAIQS